MSRDAVKIASGAEYVDAVEMTEPEHERIARERRAATASSLEQAQVDRLKSEAITELCPDAKFQVQGGVITGRGTIPTDQDISTKMQEITGRKAMEKLREARNTALSETDWKVLLAMEKGEDVDGSWVEYRQRLRDLPSRVQPVLDGRGNLITEIPSPP